MVLHPAYVKHDPFRVIYPFAIDAWALNFICFSIVILMLYIFNKYDPYEWKAAVDKKKAPEENAKNFTFANSMWFCASTLFLQGYTHTPRSNAGRCIVGFWWMFLLAMVFLYLTNITFFITSNKRLNLVGSAADVMAQKTIKFGVIKGGNTYHRLKSSPSLKKFWHKMNNDHANVYVKDMFEGIERVKSSNGRYALLGESPQLRYIASEKPCVLQVVGEYIVRTQYAMAVAKDSPLGGYLSGAVEALRENSILEDLERDWWNLEDRRQHCTNLTKWERAGVYSMTTNDIQGVYYVLMIGVGLSVIVFVVELIAFQVCGRKEKGKKRSNKQTEEMMTDEGDIRGSSTGAFEKTSGGAANQWI